MSVLSAFCRISLAATLALSGCHSNDKPVPISNLAADKKVTSDSAYPTAVDPAKVGTYDGFSKSGAGYFYDDVLEYRVWMCPDRGAKDENNGDDYFVAFAQWESAEEFSRKTKGAEKPLALVRQREWIDEPKPGHYIAHTGERITEWQVAWLASSKRRPESIQEFLKHPIPAKD
jgi:hypothetical protein